MPRAKTDTAPSVPGETTTQPTTTEETGASDAFQAQASGDTGGDQGLSETEALRLQVERLLKNQEAQNEVIANLVRAQASPATQVAAENSLPDVSDVDLDKFYAGNNTSPILTKQGWITHPRQGWNPNAPKL